MKWFFEEREGRSRLCSGSRRANLFDTIISDGGLRLLRQHFILKLPNETQPRSSVVEFRAFTQDVE